MNIQTITMDRQEARKKFLEYKRAVGARHDGAAQRIMHGYLALSRGKQLVDLAAVFRDAPYDAELRPRLAFARADWTKTHLRFEGDGSARFARDRYPDLRSKSYNLPPGTFPVAVIERYSIQHLSALVPVIPLPLRPRGSFQGYQILFEPHWDLTVPVDPILLRHVGGFAYAVVATWELTALERAVLR